MENPEETAARSKRPSGALVLYFLLSYAAVLAFTFSYVREVPLQGPLQAIFVGAVWITYALGYLLPAILPVAATALLLRIGPVRRAVVWTRVSPRLLVLSLAVLLVSLVQILLYADRFVFDLYGFHLNGFVLNLVLTPGGIDSLGSSGATDLTFAVIATGFVLLQVALAVVAVRLARRPRFARRRPGRRWVVAAVVLLATLAVGERATYAISEVRAYSPVLVSANAFPFYLPLHFEGLARALGIEPADRDRIRMRSDHIELNYPLKPIVRRPDAPRPNIVWLVSESLRWDMLTAEIMPATHAFAQRSAWFHNHVSSGNGTRMGIFGMFYGLHGPYWFPFKDERHGPVLVDLLLREHYQLGLYTSARFTYPEFDATVWANVPSDCLHEKHGSRKKGWLRDRRNVDELLDFVDGRDPARPFMTFLFFESPHAQYYFPPESVIREPYARDLNYATMDVEADAQLIKNRYINSCHHLDSQIGRILDYLTAHDLLDDTIVLITGDHAEEFMERGRWGHNSDYVREQIQVPLVLHIPGRAPERIERLTSHVDIPVTILDALGVENPPEDYSLGRDLLTGPPRKDAVVASWTKLAYVDEKSFAVFPLKGMERWQERYCTRDGEPLADEDAYIREHRERFLEIMRELKRFSR